MLDTLIINGQYPDYERGSMRQANIGIRDGIIDYIGTGEPSAREVIDAAGRVVSPGFIDIHMHEENFREEGERYCIAEMMLRMGVTTAVGGNCGIQRQSVRYFRDVIEKLGGAPVNYRMLAGYNYQRYQIGLEAHHTATTAEKETLRKMLREELAAGASGISFGIEYDPGISYEEILFAAGASEREEHLVAAHYRADSNLSIAAIREMIDVQSEIPQRFQISHLSSCCATGQMEEGLRLIHEAMARDPRLNYDTYPYNAFSTFIGSEIFAEGCFENWGITHRDILLTEEPYYNVRCTEEIFEDARRNHPMMLGVVFAMREDEIRAAVADPAAGMIASDSIITAGNGHPRCAGTFPRVLGKYVREEGALSLYDALRKMTVEPAKRLDLDRKGRITVGSDADLVIFNPDTIADKADYTAAALPPVGIDRVYVGGQLALLDGQIVNGRLGRFLVSD